MQIFAILTINGNLLHTAVEWRKSRVFRGDRIANIRIPTRSLSPTAISLIINDVAFFHWYFSRHFPDLIDFETKNRPKSRDLERFQ